MKEDITFAIATIGTNFKKWDSRNRPNYKHTGKNKENLKHFVGS